MGRASVEAVGARGGSRLQPLPDNALGPVPREEEKKIINIHSNHGKQELT